MVVITLLLLFTLHIRYVVVVKEEEAKGTRWGTIFDFNLNKKRW